jgi:hypothetical protein
MLGNWVAQSDFKAAHTFPLSFEEETTTYIFGKDAKIKSIRHQTMFVARLNRRSI